MQKHACTFLYPRRTSQATKWNDEQGESSKEPSDAEKKQAQKKCPHKGGHNKLRRAQRQQLNCQRASLQIYL